MRTPVFDFEITARLHTEETTCISFFWASGNLPPRVPRFLRPPARCPRCPAPPSIGSLLLHLLGPHLLGPHLLGPQPLGPQPLGPHRRPPRQARRRPHQVDGPTKGFAWQAVRRLRARRSYRTPLALEEPARMDACALVLAHAVQAHSLCNRFRLVLVLRAPSPTPTSPCPGPSPR